MTSHQEEPVLQAQNHIDLAATRAGCNLDAALKPNTRCVDGVNGELYINVSQITPEVETYPVPDYRNTIRGRGTTCCGVLSQDRVVSYLIGDKSGLGSTLWQNGKAFGEVRQLQLFAPESSMTTTAEGRTVEKMIPEAMWPALRHLTFSDIILDDTLQGFDSKLELTKAFRDAVCGYRNLFQVGNILHGDISVSNFVLMRKPGVQYPQRGVIIDVDIATQSDRQSSLNDIMSEPHKLQGTRAFQSLHILMHYYWDDMVAPHNFMDDLESLFYVLCWVCASYSSPGVLVDELPESLTLWEDVEPRVADGAKRQLYSGLGLEKYFNLSDYYNGAVYDLLKGLVNIFKDRYDRKKYRYEDSEAEGIFKQILDLCREAIRKLPEQETEDTSSPSSTADSEPSEKRPSTLSPDEQRPRKCSRSGNREAPLA